MATKFRPIRGIEDAIKALPITNGQLYFALDSGKIYVDTETERISVGTSGASIYYTYAIVDKENVAEGEDYVVELISPEGEKVEARVNDLLINYDGTFYKIRGFDEEGNALCAMLAVSGSGGGGGGTGLKRGRLQVTQYYGDKTKPSDTWATGETDILNGDLNGFFTIYAESASYDDNPVDDTMALTIEYYAMNSNGDYVLYDTDRDYNIGHQATIIYDFNARLRDSTNHKIIVRISGSEDNKFSTSSSTKVVNTHDLSIAWTGSKFSSNIYFDQNRVDTYAQISTGARRIYDLYFDGRLVYTKSFGTTDSTNEVGFSIVPSQAIINLDGTPTGETIAGLFTHGSHVISAQLSLAKNDGSRGSSTDLITKEIAIKTEAKPLIWLGDYKTSYYEFDSVLIPYRVYDPEAGAEGVEVHLYKNGHEVNKVYINPEKTDFTLWEITGITVGEDAYYTIRVGKDENETRRDVEFEVLEDPRGMKVVDGVTMSFEAAGRSNNESSAKRASIEFNGSPVKLTGFNWYNNGWVMDNDNKTCLRISNGARAEFEVGTMTFQGDSASTKEHTIEFLFKIRNVQDYSKIITKYTRYTDENGWDDEAMFQAFLAQRQDGYSNYDAYLAKYLPLTEGAPSYDDLIYKNTYSDPNYNSVAAYFMTELSQGNPGLCIGPQDAFFFNGTNMVTVDYVENELISLAVMCSSGTDSFGDNRLMSMYINGMLTGIARSGSSAWSIGNSDSTKLVFTSDVCDIDLYKIRVYDSALSTADIVQNYSFDLKDTEMWDQKNLVAYNNNVKEYQFSYQSMLDYNDKYAKDPENILMPYLILGTNDSNQNRLPWSKATKVKGATVEFVNTALDAAYRRGDLTIDANAEGYDSVEDFYIHHSPSFIADWAQLAVQGTSSEFYPRRNYKVKLKDGDDVIHIYLNRGPFAADYSTYKTKYNLSIPAEKLNDSGVVTNQAEIDEAKALDKKVHMKWFYYDNDTVGTTKWTLKVDYMESSGTYNMGFANLVKNCYSHHPLEDYIKSGAVNSAPEGKDLIGDLNDYRTSVQGFPVLTFHKKSDDVTPLYIGRYNMLIDKGSDECYGFKTDKKIVNAFASKANGGTNKLRDITECWEFQNNSRGFCSFRDPWNRKELSFKAPVGVADEFTANGAPIVADSYEYRYNANDDLIDALIDTNQYNEGNQALVADMKNMVPNKVTIREDGAVVCSNGSVVDLVNDKESGKQLLLDLLSNWERAVSWVWSTATDAKIDVTGDGTNLQEIPSLGTYSEIELAEALYERGKYYIYVDDTYVLCDESSYNPTHIYFRLNADKQHQSIKLTDDPSLVYAINTFYTKPDGENTNYILSDGAFDSEKVYYKLTEKTDSEFDPFWRLPSPVKYGDKTYKYDTKEYRLAKFKNELSSHFNIEYLATYFIMTEIFECYDSRGKNSMWASWGPKDEGGDYIWYPIFYDIDTQLGINNTGIPSFEYFVDATKDGTYSTNDSVLFNNFYNLFFGDIINKYKQLRGENISAGSGMGTLKYVPLDDITKINNWYLADADTVSKATNTANYSMRGKRPLLALNMDERYKYISITNDKIGWLDRNGNIAQAGDTYFYALQGNRSLSRQQFLTNRFNYINSWLTLGNYARGGSNTIRSRVSANNPVNTSDRWISGTATNGMEIITNEPYFVKLVTAADTYDSKKKYYTYSVSDMKYSAYTYNAGSWDSDVAAGKIYVENIPNNAKDPITKAHEFDGEYWITMTPARNSYVTVGTDAANFPSIKYSGSPVKFEATDLKNGVLNSGNYREQLYYIYGIDQMKSLGDLSKLYFQEFELSGKAGNMTDLLLGYDGLDENGQNYRNNDVNTWTIPAQAGTIEGGMPLLKEVNLSNINFKDTNVTFDFTSSEKMTNFRNTGSNIVAVKFADGVALNTLYLTDKTTSFTLTEANMLKGLIKTYENPVLNEITDKLEAKPGLYITNLTDKINEMYIAGSSAGNKNDYVSTNITTFSIDGGNLGYESYELLERYYNASLNSNANTVRKINLGNVVWSPYIVVDDEELVYNPSEANLYFIDDGHFGVKQYTYTSATDFKLAIMNRQLYKFTGEFTTGSNGRFENYPITNTALLEHLIDNNKFISTAASNNEIPNITGYIFIDNADAVNEEDIQMNLKAKYPNLHFFFRNVTKGYSAKFVLEENGVQTVIKTQKIGRDEYLANTAIFFNSPADSTHTDSYISESALRDLKSNDFDFLGWAYPNNTKESIVLSNTGTDRDGNLVVPEDERIDEWANLRITADVYDYTFYAIFDSHKYVMTWIDGDGSTVLDTTYIVAGQKITETTKVPSKDDSELADINGEPQAYRFTGNWATENGNKPTSLLATRNYTFYPEIAQVGVHTQATDEKYFNITSDGVLSPKVVLSGKITIPSTINGIVVKSISGFGDSKITHMYFMPDSQIAIIAAYCFLGNTYIKEVELLPSLEKVQDQAFANCSALTRSDWRAATGLTYVGASAFQRAFASSVSMVYLPANITTIADNAFKLFPNTTAISELIIGSEGNPTQLTTLGETVFQQGTGLATMSKSMRVTVYIPAGQEDVYTSLFANCFGSNGYQTLSLVSV